MTQSEMKEKLLALTSKLDEVRAAKNKRANVFRACGMNTQEVKHSAFLAWMLDPTKPHGCGNAFLKKFCDALVNYSAADDEYKPNCEIISAEFSRLDALLNDKDIKVDTERVVVNADSRTDIFIVSAAARTVIVIENKVFTSYHDNQLERYEKDTKAHEEYRNYNKVFVYLTPTGELPDRSGWCVLDYATIVKIAKELVDGLPRSKAYARTRILLEDYIDLVETDILKVNKELRKLCKEILREYSDEIDYLKGYNDNAAKVIEFAATSAIARFDIDQITKGSALSAVMYTKQATQLFARYGEDPLAPDGRPKCRIGFGCEDGPIVANYSLYKRRIDKWSAAQLAVIAAADKNKKLTEMYYTLVQTVLLSEEDREKPFEEVKAQIDKNLTAFIENVRQIESKFATSEI